MVRVCRGFFRPGLACRVPEPAQSSPPLLLPPPCGVSELGGSLCTGTRTRTCCPAPAACAVAPPLPLPLPGCAGLYWCMEHGGTLLSGLPAARMLLADVALVQGGLPAVLGTRHRQLQGWQCGIQGVCCARRRQGRCSEKGEGTEGPERMPSIAPQATPVPNSRRTAGRWRERVGWERGAAGGSSMAGGQRVRVWCGYV